MFQNWNKYKSEKASAQPSWGQVWKIPEHHGWAWGTKGTLNYNIVKDPVASSDYVIEAIYPKGSNNPASTPIGGIGFYASPLPLKGTPKTLTFQYQVLFPKGFDFVKGGKLPGLWANKEECTGGNSATDCFSTRFMWRTKGMGEIYTYINQKAQLPSLCDPSKPQVKKKIIYCNPNDGVSIGRGTWTFQPGTWNTIKQEIQMNSPGKKDGKVTLFHNGKQAFQQKGLVLIKNGSIKSLGIAFHTFFGGNGQEYSTPKKQQSYFKDFTFSYQ